MKNYQNELLTSILNKADLREQLEAMEAQGITCLILPSQAVFYTCGFENCRTFTEAEWQARKYQEYEDNYCQEDYEAWKNDQGFTDETLDESYRKIYDAKQKQTDFEEWLVQDEDDLYVSVEGLIDYYLEWEAEEREVS